MRWNRGFASWLLSLLILGGIVALFILPVMLTATPLQIPPLPDPIADAAEVEELLETTYLGRSKEFPDPGEPAVVLRKYLEQNAHGYHQQLAERESRLDVELTAWKALTQQYSQSRHALVALAKHYSTKARASGNIAFTRQAADAYIQAADIGLTHGRIRYTRELSDLLAELGDKKGLDAIFGRILSYPQDLDADYYYLALVDYADGLARLSDEPAWDYFEEAIAGHPENNEEAINRYARLLLDRGNAQQALTVLDTYLTPEQRISAVVPVFLRKEAMEALAMDLASAEAEISIITQRLTTEPLMGYSLVENSSTAARAPTSVAADNSMAALFAPTPAFAQIPENPVSTVFAAMTNTSFWKTQLYIDNTVSAFVASEAPPGVGVKKLATLKFPVHSTNCPSGNCGGVAVIGTDNTVRYRYFNGSSWQSWQALGGSAVDVAAVVYANGQADIFRTDGCNIYNSHSVNGKTFGQWVWWGACGDQIAAAIMPGGTGWFALRATGAGNQAVVRYYNGAQWDSSSPIPWTALGGVVNDLALTPYANPSQVFGIRMTLWAVGADNSTIQYWNSSGTSWAGPATWTSGFKSVSSFNTSDGGAHLIFLGTNNNYLYTERFTGSGWGGIVLQSVQSWAAAAGANFKDENDPPYEHNVFNDDCRRQDRTCYPDPNVPGECFRAYALNLAEILYNEARGETKGAQAVVGWTVRDRAYQALKNNCDSYPGAQGGALTTTCRNTVPCGDPFHCEDSKKYCCAMHGGTTSLGAPQYQFNDEHVPFSTLYNAGFAYRAVHILNGFIPDVSTGFVPSGVSNCTINCTDPFCFSGVNGTQASPAGPVEYRSYDYRSQVSGLSQYAATCKTWKGNVCPGGAPGDNYFFNRTP